MARPPVFGQPLAALINANMGPLMGPATLTVRVPGARGGDVTAGTNPTTTAYACKGFKEKTTVKRGTPSNDGEAASLIRTSNTKITILGGSLPDAIDPKPGDQILIDGGTYVIDEVGAAPGSAVFECRCTGPA